MADQLLPCDLAPASRWGLSCAESACVTDLKGRSSWVAQNGSLPVSVTHSGPAGVQTPAGLSCAAQRLARLALRWPAFEGLSYG